MAASAAIINPMEKIMKLDLLTHSAYQQLLLAVQEYIKGNLHRAKFQDRHNEWWAVLDVEEAAASRNGVATFQNTKTLKERQIDLDVFYDWS